MHRCIGMSFLRSVDWTGLALAGSLRNRIWALRAYIKLIQLQVYPAAFFVELTLHSTRFTQSGLLCSRFVMALMKTSASSVRAWRSMMFKNIPEANGHLSSRRSTMLFDRKHMIQRIVTQPYQIQLPLLQETAPSPRFHELANNCLVHVRFARNRGRRLGGLFRQICRPFGNDVMIIL